MSIAIAEPVPMSSKRLRRTRFIAGKDIKESLPNLSDEEAHSVCVSDPIYVTLAFRMAYLTAARISSSMKLHSL